MLLAHNAIKPLTRCADAATSFVFVSPTRPFVAIAPTSVAVRVKTTSGIAFVATRSSTESFVIPKIAKRCRGSICSSRRKDAPSLQDPNGVGRAVVDNLDINAEVITTGNGIADGPDRREGGN